MSPVLPAALVLCLSATCAAEMTFSEPVRVEDRDAGSIVSTTTATNTGRDAQTVEVTVGGQKFVAGSVSPGESASVTVIEGPGRPVILFDKR